MSTVRKAALLAVALIAPACGTYRVVNRTPSGGIVAHEGRRDKAMAKAHTAMADHCRGPYTIVEEGEHVIGHDTTRGEETHVADDGTVVTGSGESTRDATEWRIRYVCGSASVSDEEDAAVAGASGL